MPKVPLYLAGSFWKVSLPNRGNVQLEPFCAIEPLNNSAVELSGPPDGLADHHLNELLGAVVPRQDEVV